MSVMFLLRFSLKLLWPSHEKTTNMPFFTDWLICNFRECHPIIIVQRIRVTSCFCQLPRPTDLWAFDQQDSTQMRDACLCVYYVWLTLKHLYLAVKTIKAMDMSFSDVPEKCAPNSYFSAMCRIWAATEGYFRSLYIFHCIWVKPIPQLLWVHDQHQNGGNIDMSCNVLNWAFNSSVRSPYTAGPMISEHPKFSTGNSMLRMLWGPPPTALRSARRTSPVAVSCWNFDQRASLLSQKQSQKETRQESQKVFKTSNKISGHEIPPL